MVYIDDPGALIAAVPRWLAYHPRRSVVLILLFDTDTPASVVRAGHIARVDLELPDGSVAAQQVAIAGFSLCGRYRPDAVCAVVVDDDPDTTTPAHRYQEMITLLSERIEVWSIPLLDAWVTSVIEPGRSWWSLLYPGNTDTQPSTGSGLGVRAPEPDRAARTAALLTDQPPRPGTEEIVPSHPDRPDPAWVHQRAQFVLALVHAVAGGDWPSPEQVAELATCLRETVVRDFAYGFIGTRLEEPALRLWTLAWQTLPPGHRTDAALLTALTSGAAGDWATAHAAAASILIDDPTHRLAHYLSGLQPGQDRSDLIRDVARSAQATAAQIGLRIE